MEKKGPTNTWRVYREVRLEKSLIFYSLGCFNCLFVSEFGGCSFTLKDLTLEEGPDMEDERSEHSVLELQQPLMEEEDYGLQLDFVSFSFIDRDFPLDQDEKSKLERTQPRMVAIPIRSDTSAEKISSMLLEVRSFFRNCLL